MVPYESLFGAMPNPTVYDFILSSLSGPSGVYRPGSVLKYTCEVNLVSHPFSQLVDLESTLHQLPFQPGSLVVPVLAATRVCRKGKWDGQVSP